MIEKQIRQSIQKRKWTIASAPAGLLVGVFLTTLAVWLALPGMMIVTEESRLGLDETVASMQQAIERQGWVSSGTTDMNKSLAEHGVQFSPRVKVVKLCKPEYAESVLSTDRHVACLMPCSIAVWEDDDGKVYVSKMNTGLMGKMFGGNIAEVMGGHVSRDEHVMLSGILE